MKDILQIYYIELCIVLFEGFRVTLCFDQDFQQFRQEIGHR